MSRSLFRERYKPTAEEISQLKGDGSQCWHRASGSVVCSICGKLYYDHPQIEEPYEFLNRVCNGDFVKL